MSSEWDENAEAWIDHVGARGDFSREHILDPVLLKRVRKYAPRSALDVGCGEGRFCRLLNTEKITATGIDPTEALIAQARKQDPENDYRLARAEELPFTDNRFDLVVSYLTLIDIEDFQTAISEMTRVLRPGGHLLIANVASFFSAGTTPGWKGDGGDGESGFPIDHYFTERAELVKIGSFKVRNWHRPLSAYMKCLVDLGLTLSFFDEPAPISGARDLRAAFSRVPPFVVMEWKK